MERAKIIIALIVIVLVAIVGLQNTEGVDAAILFFNVKVPLTVLLLISFAGGMVAGLLIALWLRTRRKATERAE